MIDQRSETVRVCVRRHLPVAQARPIVTPRAEPAVVEHEPFDTDACCAVGEGPQRVEVVVEVHRLPGVHQHRPGCDRMGRARSQVAMELLGGCRQPTIAVHGDHLGGRVRLAGFERQLAGVEQLTELYVSSSVGQPFGEDRVVAAPCEVRPPHRAPPLPEIGRAGEDERRVFVGRATAPVLGGVGAVRPRNTHRLELAGPATRERAELTGVLRYGKGDRERVEQVALVVAGVGQPCPDDQGVIELEVDVEREPCDRVVGVDHQPVAVEFVPDALDRRGEPRCPRRATPAMAEQPRSAGVARSVLGYDRQRADDVGRAVHQRALDRRHDIVDVVRVTEAVERRAPVHDPRRTRRCVDEHVTRAPPQMDHVVRSLPDSSSAGRVARSCCRSAEVASAGGSCAVQASNGRAARRTACNRSGAATMAGRTAR